MLNPFSYIPRFIYKARVKRAIKMDPEVKQVSAEAVALMTKATELFVAHFALKASSTVALRGNLHSLLIYY